MEQIVVFAFDSDVDGTCIIVMLHISYHSSCKSSVWVQTLVYFFNDETSLVFREVEKR